MGDPRDEGTKQRQAGAAAAVSRKDALALAIDLMHDRSFEFPGRDALLTDYEQIAVGCAERLLEWMRTGKYSHD